MTTTEDALATDLPTDAEVDAFRRSGWYLSRKVVPDELLDAAIEGSERFYAGESDGGPPVQDRFVPVPPLPPGLRKHDYSSLRKRELGALVRLPVIGAIGARLMGTDVVRLWHDQLLYKPSTPPGERSGNVGWHTDRSYWRACTSDNMVTAWVPFHDITIEHGPLMVIEGSNTWGRGDVGTPDFFVKDLDAQERELRETGRTITKVPILMERGQVSFHHCRTYHGSGPNTSGVPRRSLAIHLQPGDNRASMARRPDGELHRHNNAELCREVDGIPDFTDPTYCPVLHPQQA